MKRLLLVVALIAMIPLATFAAEEEIVGTYKLVSATRKILDTGEVKDAYGKNPSGSVIYEKNGRFIVIITADGRPQPESVDKITDEQRAALFKTLVAYGGTYIYDGQKIEHHIDISWNEVWTGTTVIRDVRRENNRIVYTTRPAPFASDGKMNITTLVWEKVKTP